MYDIHEKEEQYRFGSFRLYVRKISDALAQVSVYDVGNIRFPLMWSKTMTTEQARGAVDLFEAVGYFAMPV